MTNRNTVDAQARWARAFHRRVTGSQTRLANATPAIAVPRLGLDTPSSLSPPATTAISSTVPTTASTNRRMADQVPVARVRRRAGRNKEAEPTGAATSAASSKVSSMPAPTLHFRSVLLTNPGGSMRGRCRIRPQRDRSGRQWVSGSSRPGGRYFSPSALASSSRPILDRPGRSRRLAISYSSARVLGEAAPVRRRWATAAPCFPSAVRVFSGRCAIVLLAVAACLAIFTLAVAARRVLVAPAVALCRVFAALDVAARRVLVAPAVALSWAFAALAAAAFWAFFALFLAAFSAFLSAFFCFFFAIVPRFRGLYCPPPAGCLTGAGKEAGVECSCPTRRSGRLDGPGPQHLRRVAGY